MSRNVAAACRAVLLAMVIAGCGSKPNPIEYQKYQAMMNDQIWTHMSIDGQPSQLLGNSATSGSWGGSNGMAFKSWTIAADKTDAEFESAVKQAVASGVILNSVYCDLKVAGGTKVVAGDWPASFSIGVTRKPNEASSTAELGVDLTLGDGDHTKFGPPSTDFRAQGCPQDFIDAIHKTS